MHLTMPSAGPAFQAAHHGSPRPTLYIARSNGTFVPLIPADELPFNIQLVGVDRVLYPGDLIGMRQVDYSHYTGLTYQLVPGLSMQRTSSSSGPSHTRSTSGLKINHFLHPITHAHQASGVSNSTTLSPISGHSTANWRNHPTSDTDTNPQDVINAIINTQSGVETAARIRDNGRPKPLPPSGKYPNQDNKRWCTYWIRTGGCDYMQQGCAFLHEMPSLETLRQIGVNHYPTWWKEQNQRVRLGTEGQRSTAGPPMRPAEWLGKGTRSNESDGDSDACDGEQQDQGRRRLLLPVPNFANANANASTAQPDAANSSTTDSPTANVAAATNNSRLPMPQPPQGQATATATPPLASNAPSSIAVQTKPSVTDDLISFADLIPSAPSSATTPAIPSPVQVATTPSPAPTIPTPTSPKGSATVFVPAGESADTHIAEAKRHQHAAKRNHNAKTVKALPLDRQIQEVQRNNHASGMMASKHAPKEGEAIGRTSPTGGKGKERQGLRQRIPKPRSPIQGAGTAPSVASPPATPRGASAPPAASRGPPVDTHMPRL